MLQQRPFLARCVLACLLALLGLFTVTNLSLGAAVPIEMTVARQQIATITSTTPLDFSPENGSFIDTLKSLPGVQAGSASWGDCNNDGASDVLLTGQVSSTLDIARVYQQQAGGNFTLAAVLTGVVHSAAAWGDYDNDGWLDIALTGEDASGRPISLLYHNERNSATCTFSLVAANLIGVRYGTVAWGDYNADGQLDLLVAGDAGSQPVTKIYRNDHGSFTDSGLNLRGIEHGAAVWGDYDNDGLADLLLTGSDVDGNPLTKLYHNDGHGALNEVQTNLPALRDSAAAWGDYNNDGQLDLLLEGDEVPTETAAIYRNDQGVFVKNDLANNLLGSLGWTGAAWGDYDTDGYLDALISSNGLAMAYRNEITGTFASGLSVGSSALVDGSAAWGQYDGDGNLDVLVTGQSLSGRITKIYRYSNLTLSQPPGAPLTLTTSLVGSNVVLRWSPPASDDHTPLTGLSYNLRVGTQPGGIDVIAPMAITGTGDRLLPALGNVYQAPTYTLRNLSVGQKYYWSVQAIDTSFLGSAFAEEGAFQIPYRVFLPVVLKNFISYYTSDEETEPNDTYQQANGPLESGRAYRGKHDDERDYYSVYLLDPGALSVDMDSPNGGTQLQLFYQVADVAHRVGVALTPPYQITYTGSSGWYYIYVYTDSRYMFSQTYTLTATYP